jgi:hypothetical protein
LTEVYSLSLFFRSGQKVDLFYQSEARAVEIFNIFRSVLDSETLIPTIDDNYGTRIVMFRHHPAMHALMLQDCARASEVAIDVSLIQARSW